MPQRLPRAVLTRLYAAAVAAVDPLKLVSSHLIRDGSGVIVRDHDREIFRHRGPLLIVGAGKAAAKMAAGCEVALGPDLVSGAVIVADGCTWPLESISVREAGHPVPDERGEDATARLCQLVSETSTPVLCLVSGGASSLLVRPRPPVTLADKQAVNRLLLSCGANVGEINTVRKHLSRVKGGGLLRQGSSRFVTLVLSDVIGDDPRVIGSGPTAADPTTFADARAILHRYAIERRTPSRAAALLDRGVRGEVPETLKAGEPDCLRVRHLVVGSNRSALEATAEEARRMGLHPRIRPAPLEGATGPAARRWIQEVKADLLGPSPSADCHIAGGETTVTITGTGRGGRNQEFALAIASALAGTDICVLSAGSDGVDGPTDAAGAFVDGSTSKRARDNGLEPDDALANNDSYGFFVALGDLFRPGPTGTNVMDVKIALRPTI